MVLGIECDPVLFLVFVTIVFLIFFRNVLSISTLNPITRKSMSKLVIQPSFRAVGQTHAE